MLWLDGLFRFSGIGFLVLLTVILLRDAKDWKSKPYMILASISVAALFLGYAPEALQPPEPIYSVSRFLDIPHLVFVWLFTLSLYDSNFRLTPIHWICGILYSLPILYIRLFNFGVLPEPAGWIFIYGSLTSIALMGHLCYVTLSGRSDDLLESRRTSRIYFILMIVFVAVAAAIIDIGPREIFGIDRRTAKIITIWPAIVWGVLWLLAFNQRAAYFGWHSSSGRQLANRDEALKAKLQALMKEDEAFREMGLTISSIATRLGVSQHRLRALINHDLGYANFSSYLNTLRIDAVKQAFENPKTSHLPILTIAMDCGFKSLSTFNKAFKTLEGVTPTAFRRGYKT